MEGIGNSGECQRPRNFQRGVVSMSFFQTDRNFHTVVRKVSLFALKINKLTLFNEGSTKQSFN